MTTNHIDQLAEWYESAERITKTNLPQAGDIIIQPFAIGDGYQIEVDHEDWTPDVVREVGERARILSRAPKPKPAWHDAVAVIAHTDYGHIRQVWERDSETGYWLGIKGSLVRTDTLNDVTPLIEAKVTDEMVKRAREAFTKHSSVHVTIGPDLMRKTIAAALGLDPA